MIKGFINADNRPIATSMIVDPSNRTAAVMCFEIGLVAGVDEKENVIVVRDGQKEIVNDIAVDIRIDDPHAKICFPTEVESIKRNQPPDDPSFVSTDINDIPDEPEIDPPETDIVICHFEWYGKCLCDNDLTGVVMSTNMAVVTCVDCRKKFGDLQSGHKSRPGSGVSY